MVTPDRHPMTASEELAKAFRAWRDNWLSNPTESIAQWYQRHKVLSETLGPLLDRFDAERPLREAEREYLEAQLALESHDRTPHSSQDPDWWGRTGSRLWGVKQAAYDKLLAARAAQEGTSVTKTDCATDGSQKADGGQA